MSPNFKAIWLSQIGNFKLQIWNLSEKLNEKMRLYYNQFYN